MFKNEKGIFLFEGMILFFVVFTVASLLYPSFSKLVVKGKELQKEELKKMAFYEASKIFFISNTSDTVLHFVPYEITRKNNSSICIQEIDQRAVDMYCEDYDLYFQEP